MPEGNLVAQKKPEKADNTRHNDGREKKPITQGLLSWDLTSYLVGGSAAGGQTQKHKALLSKASPGERITITRQLQQMYGNRYVQRLVSSIVVQTKLTVGVANDPLENEADSVAEKVMTMPAPSAAGRVAIDIGPKVHKRDNEGDEEVQEKPIAAQDTTVVTQPNPSDSFEAGEKIQEKLESGRGRRNPFPGEVRSFMEPRFRADFSSVRIHTKDESAELNRDLSAQAFTGGQDIYLGKGKDNLQTTEGKKPVAHELTHVVQQDEVVQPKITVGAANDPLEHEADQVAEIVMKMPALPAAARVAVDIGLSIHKRVTEEDDEVEEKPISAEVMPVVQRPETGDSFEVEDAIEEKIKSLKGQGSPLPDETRSFMEPRFGADFSGVRLHADNESAELNRALSAQAFTHGQDIYLGEGKTNLETTEGKRLLAHELTHVVQQSSVSLLRRQAATPTETNIPETNVNNTKTPVPKAPDPAKLSGKAWWDANENKEPLNKKSSDTADLKSPFKENVEAFKKALEDAGASISIDTTLRPKERAHVLHYAWQVGKGTVKASDVPVMDGVDIIWDHGDDAKSKAGANEIITAANVASKPSLTSRHIEGKAIDWTIEWTTPELKITNKDGVEVIIKSTPHNGGDPGNTELHTVGKGYGVIKGLNFNPKDPPHWSSDGH